MLLDVPFTHWVTYSNKPLAKSGCRCDATKSHMLGEEIVLKKPDWGKMARQMNHALAMMPK